MKNYKVFTRNWWKHNTEWSDGLEPDASGRRNTIGYAETLKEAQKMCKEWNENNKPGKLSRKAEFTSSF